jgi:hypothetical protein
MDEFNKLADDLAGAGITKSNMFGMPVLKLGRKPIAGLTDDGINFKLPAESGDMKAALTIPSAHLFQPEMHGKKGPLMKQWVVVPFAHKDKYIGLSLASIKFVESEINNK